MKVDTLENSGLEGFFFFGGGVGGWGCLEIRIFVDPSEFGEAQAYRARKSVHGTTSKN